MPEPAAAAAIWQRAGSLNDSRSTFPRAAASPSLPRATSPPAATGSLVNTATVTAPGTVFDPDTANNTATDTDTLTPQTDLQITKTDGATTEIPGTPVTYTITATNAGPSTATGVSVTDIFPAELTGCIWTAGAANGAIGYSPAGAGNIGDSAMTFPPTGAVTYTVTCNIDPAARGSLANTATVASATADPTSSNNSFTDTDTLTPQVDLTVAKVESIDPVIAGSGAGNLTHTITLTNAGPSTATSVTLSESLTLPAGVTLVSITPSQGTFSTPTWSAGTLAPAGSATLTVVVTAAASAATGTDTVCDTATVTGATETLINTGNDSDNECTSVTRRVDMVVSKTESIDPVVAGSGVGNLTYVVTVANNGPSDGSGVALSEVLTLPAGVTLASATPSQGTFASPTWTVGGLATGTNATLTVVVTASAAAAPGTDVICDTATLTAVNETQVATGNEADSECTSITVSADLEITKNRRRRSAAGRLRPHLHADGHQPRPVGRHRRRRHRPAAGRDDLRHRHLRRQRTRRRGPGTSAALANWRHGGLRRHRVDQPDAAGLDLEHRDGDRDDQRRRAGQRLRHRGSRPSTPCRRR